MYFYDRKKYRRRKKYAGNESMFSQKLFIIKISEEEIIRVLYYAKKLVKDRGESDFCSHIKRMNGLLLDHTSTHCVCLQVTISRCIERK